MSMRESGDGCKTRILFVIDVMWVAGGTENHVCQLARALDREQFDCTILTFDGRPEFLDRLRSNGLDVRCIPVDRLYSFRAIFGALEMRDLIRQKKIDIVQTFHFKSDTYGVLVARLSGVRRIVSSRRDTGFKKRPFEVLISRLANPLIHRFITVSNAVGECLQRSEGVPPARIVTIYNGVDLDRYRVPTAEEISDARRRLGIEDGDFVVGIVGHMRPEKGHDLFFRAILEAMRVVPTIKALVVGGKGNLYDTYSKFWSENSMDDRVIFTGLVNDVRPYVKAFDVACVASSTEGMSNALLEGMALGKPVIVTGVGGNTEVVVEGESGIIIPLDSKRLAAAIRHLHDHPSERERIGKNARRRVEDLFGMESMIGSHEALYREMMTGVPLAL